MRRCHPNILEVQASDNATPALVATAEVTVAITNVPSAPVLTVSGTQTLTLNEGTVASTMATGHTVSAMDEDGDEVAFSVDDDRFAVADDGTLNVLADKIFDHETENPLTLTITGTDNSTGKLTDTGTADIAITDLAEAPVITVSGTQTLTLEEGTTATETATGHTVAAVDGDGDVVTFSLDDDRFAVDTNGVLNVLANKVFDHETEATVTLTVIATDDSSSTLSSTEVVDIIITNVPTAPVITVSGTQTLVLEKGITASLMATGFMVSATDEDDDGVDFSLIDDRFDLANDGMLNVLANKEFDYEDAANPSGEITLTITVTDDNTGALTDTEDVTVTLTNVTFSASASVLIEDIGNNANPAFGDVEGDGDEDLLVGVVTGGLSIWYRLSDGTWSTTSDF